MKTPKEKDDNLIYPSEEFGNEWRFNTQKKGDTAKPTRCHNCGNKNIYLYGEGWYCDPNKGGCGYTINASDFFQGRNSKEKEVEKLIDGLIFKINAMRNDKKYYHKYRDAVWQCWKLIQELKQKFGMLK